MRFLLKPALFFLKWLQSLSNSPSHQELEQLQAAKSNELGQEHTLTGQLKRDLDEIQQSTRRQDKEFCELKGSLCSLRAQNAEMGSQKQVLEREVASLKEGISFRKRVIRARKPFERAHFISSGYYEPEDESLCVILRKRTPAPIYEAVAIGAHDFDIPADLPSVDAVSPQWAFEEQRQGKVVVIDADQAKTLENRLYFIGDIHGEIAPVRRMAEAFFRQRRDAVLIFLGDLIDRGAESLKAVRLVVWLAKRFPGQILWLAGNHDLGLHFDEKQNRFLSEVDPGEFADELNTHANDWEEAQRIIRLTSNLPVACIVGNVWASHGGIPQSDVCDQFEDFSRMSKPMLADCVWSRLCDARSKLPNRAHRGAEVGFEQARNFFTRIKEKQNIDIRHIICAHQHRSTGDLAVSQHTRHFKPEQLSCQCIFSFHDSDNVPVHPCYAIYRGTQTPLLHSI